MEKSKWKSTMYLNHLSYEFFIFKKLLDNWNILLFQKAFNISWRDEWMHVWRYVCIFPYILAERLDSICKASIFSNNFILQLIQFFSISEIRVNDIAARLTNKVTHTNWIIIYLSKKKKKKRRKKERMQIWQFWNHLHSSFKHKYLMAPLNEGSKVM